MAPSITIEHAIHWEGNVIGGKYNYLTDLLHLQSCTDGFQAPLGLQKISSPLTDKLSSWEEYLQCHPDKQFRQFIIKGLEEGFHIGFNREHLCRSSSHNLLSCLDHPRVVQSYIEKECSLGRMVGPFPQGEPSGLHLSPFGVIPKKAKDKWRLIVDLSAPRGASINDGISQPSSSLAYVTIDMIADWVRSLGRGTLLAKLDVQSAFRLIPVHPSDRLLLGMEWSKSWYVDTVLPFGLRSAPKLFNAISDAIQYMAWQQGVQHIAKYLDDFIILGPPDSPQCGLDLGTIIELYHHLGVPLAPEKFEGPEKKLEILGIVVDTVAMQLSLPGKKISDLGSILQSWLGKKTATKRDAQSLAGKLQHAANVVRPGRCFIRHIYDLTALKGGPNQVVRLNRHVRSDIQWWYTFITSWNGISLFWKSRSTSPDVQVWSDASGNWGCGALSLNRWLQLEWPPILHTLSIAHKELIPIVIAGFVWGRSWAGRIVQFNCDNQAVVTILS